LKASSRSPAHSPAGRGISRAAPQLPPLDKGYPADNTIFQAPERAILYQGNARVFDEDITRPEALVDVVSQFFDTRCRTSKSGGRRLTSFPSGFPSSQKL